MTPETKKYLQEVHEKKLNAFNEINSIAQGKRKWTMSIPVRGTDSDMTLQSPLDEIEKLIALIEKQDAVIERYRKTLLNITEVDDDWKTRLANQALAEADACVAHGS